MAPQDPQIEFQDSNGNPKGYVYINNNDNVVLHHPGSGNEAILQDDGTFDVPTVKTDYATVNTQLTKPSGHKTSIGSGIWNEKVTEATIADDDVFVNKHNTMHRYEIFVQGKSEYAFVTAATYNGHNLKFKEGSISDEGNTDLTGTTGPDNSLNLSKDGNYLHIENRLGSSVDIVLIMRGNR